MNIDAEHEILLLRVEQRFRLLVMEPHSSELTMK
jgi:hypothetical protein